MNRKNGLFEKYPWLKITTSVENYVEPNYYDRLLKDYVFKRKSDLVYLRDFLSSLRVRKTAKILELGCGNGRATKVALTEFPNAHFDLVDLSPRMLKDARERFAEKKTPIHYVRSDSVTYLENTNEIYDVIFTLWSFSHSTHQILSKMGLRDGKRRIQKAIRKFVLKNMKVGSVFFLIHFDSLSDEQKILIRQWKRVYPIFRDNRQQSPSKRYIDEVLKKLLDDGIIKFSAMHYKGKPIIYRSLDEALEIFMNFHMESFFNESSHAKEIIEDLTKYFKRFEKLNGSIEITPGCFVYKFIKIR
jgi:SAM-dependent methyltransferase